jgi:FxsC-like protein
MADYYYFMSYARRDGSDGYVRKFWDDLSNQIARVEGLPSNLKPKDIGFFDRAGIIEGKPWPPTLIEALQKSKVLVCLYSPSYFNSVACGKEFKVFQSRLAAQSSTSFQETDTPPLIIPILWDCPRNRSLDVPGSVSHIQMKEEQLTSSSPASLYELMRNSSYISRRREFIRSLAEWIAELANTYTIPSLSKVPPLDQIESAFVSTAQAPPASLPSDNTGPGVAKFVFVAGRRNELERIRKHVDAYGREGGSRWRPYLDDEVWLISQRAATDQRVQFSHVPVDKDLLEKLRRAEKDQEIVLLLVDPWSLKLDTYEQHMRKLDMETFFNSEILIPWNEEDEETGPRHDELQAHLKEILNRRYVALNMIGLRDAIGSADELQQELVEAISRLGDRIRQQGRPYREVSGRISLPRNFGSGGAD